MLSQDACGHCQLYRHCVLCAQNMTTADCSNCSSVDIRLVPDSEYDSAVGKYHCTRQQFEVSKLKL